MGAVNSPRRKPFEYIFCILLGPQSCLIENHSKAKPLPICSRTPHRHRAQACVVTSVLLRLGDPGLPLPPAPGAYLADGAVPARLHVVFALIAGVDEAVLALGVQLHQHAHGGPLGSSE